MYGSTYLNPFGFGQQIQQPIQPVQSIQPVQVVRVNGENGARAYQIGPNSSSLLLDESGTMVWLCVTDGAGYKTVTPYDITPHQSAPAPDYTTLEQRITKLEELINGNTADSSTASKGKPSGKSGTD